MPSPSTPSPYSYQHARPNVVNVDDLEHQALVSITTTDDNGGYFEFHPRRTGARACFNRRGRGCGLLRAPWSSSQMLLASCTMVVVVLMGSMALFNNTTSTTSSFTADYLAVSMTEGPPNPNQPEGTYDWQKCQHSDDPDCWKKEGERVGSFWQNFGTEMSTYWSNWGHDMHEYWENVFHHNTTNVTDTTTTTASAPTVPPTEISAPAVVETTTTETATPKLHHHSTRPAQDEALAP